MGGSRPGSIIAAFMHTPLGQDEILYIGKAHGCSVRQRWKAGDKMLFWRALESERRIFEHVVLVGEICLEAGRRLTRELLSDVERLPINEIKPYGNIACIRRRIIRPGLRVTCTGAWPLSTRRFTDVPVDATRCLK